MSTDQNNVSSSNAGNASNLSLSRSIMNTRVGKRYKRKLPQTSKIWRNELGKRIYIYLNDIFELLPICRALLQNMDRRIHFLHITLVRLHKCNRSHSSFSAFTSAAPAILRTI